MEAEPGSSEFLLEKDLQRYLAGNLSMLGALPYLAPLFSTLLLIAVGQSDAKPILMIRAVLIITGAVIATSPSTRDAITPQRCRATRYDQNHAHG